MDLADSARTGRRLDLHLVGRNNPAGGAVPGVTAQAGASRAGPARSARGRNTPDSAGFAHLAVTLPSSLANKLR